MEIVWYIVFGFASGILGGMGMGGGTLLIPLLNFLDLPQQSIQAANLISFLPMAVVALTLHFRNGLVQTKETEWLIIPAAITAAVGAFWTKDVSAKLLRICFGIFLVLLGVWQFVKGVKSKKAQGSEKERSSAEGNGGKEEKAVECGQSDPEEASGRKVQTEETKKDRRE